MYKAYFGFKDDPFSIAPDPQFLYMSERHREALAHLIYGVKTAGGFVLLTGEVGTGKTTICRCLLEQIPANSEIAFVLNPKLTAIELLATICDELGIDYPAGTGSSKTLIDAINTFLLDAHSKGCKTVLIIDEAQNLRADVLEQIRLLTNLETNKLKLLQVIMLGQPELKQMLESQELRQLAQRITARYHLEPLSKGDIQAYISHRLAVAGVERPLFSSDVISSLYSLSGGVPRLINILCDRALLGAYVKEQSTVNKALLREAANEVLPRKTRPKIAGNKISQFLVPVLLLGSVVLGMVLWKVNNPLPPLPTQTVASALPVAPTSQLAVLKWDAKQSVSRSSVLAYQALFSVWGGVYSSQEGDASSQAFDYGLQLMTKRGSLGRLRQLNRPAVLKLTDQQGQEYYVTLIALDDKLASLVVGTQLRDVTINTLEQQWFGEFAMLWQVPPNYKKPVKPGEHGPVVQWLEQQMSTINGRAARSESSLSLRGQLLDEVQQFQTAAGLEPDGVVGSYTLIHINTRLDNRQPTLDSGQKG